MTAAPRIAALLAPLLLAAVPAGAGVVNVEFKFTPFTGDPAKDDQVQTVPGQARVALNGVPVAEQPVEKQTLPVMFDEREVAPAVWIPVESLGPAVRKGKNTIRIEFVPADPKAAYVARLAWASVMDEAREEESPGSYRGTNMSPEGRDERKTTGTVVLEREFVADFAKDQPWHHLPPVTTLTDDDRAKLAALVQERAAAWKPDFAGVYRLLDGRPGLDVAAARKAKCLDAAWAAGVRIAAPAADQLEVVTTNGPEVVVRRKGGNLYALDPKAFERIKDDDQQMCAGVTLSMAYPQRLVAVRRAEGAWEVAY